MYYPQKIPDTALSNLRLICLDLPEVYEENAWVGIRWRIKKKNFAHVLMIEEGYPPAYSKASGLEGPACVLTFRFSEKRLETSHFSKLPFFKPVWWSDIAGIVLDETTDWEEIENLLKQSYCLLAPTKLANQVDEWKNFRS
ncbi:MmcQ/YjbR family DNA-binding protein [Leptospira sarikeiensis]|uniref:MmcQ/YjbR family DNA-binding protein n=1 Tax=Leptospira sarikeiensis TaxID=2484943 RepID=A0A4R9K9I1_9LEPT|nr:MmcQ/YjbR family DNA-binding protein [Leptospira sarikeiensis]TGL63328.1 MmcQ/YjbR family DNA-binding protein [Leptospira sarikeiensis]